MDQDAFRALLTSAPAGSATPSRRLAQPSRANGRLSLASSNNSKSQSNLEESAYKPASASSLKPRKFKSKDASGESKEGGPSRGGYRDRASERRQGLDGDFAEAEHLLENFQARVAAAGTQVDKDVLEQQTKYLGGDERHTILVKGLDHALLERRKAELSEGGKLGQVTDDDLEAAFAQNERHNPPPPEPSTSSGKKRRDELLERLKASRNSSGRQPADLVVVDKLKAAGKFKPIGLTSVDQKQEEEERKERKRRKAEKKKKKALKAEKAAVPKTSLLPPISNSPSDEVPVKSLEPATKSDTPQLKKNSASKEPQGVTHSSPPTHVAITNREAPKPGSSKEIDATQEEDHDLDIFGDAGEYKGLGDSSDDESEDHRPQNGPLTVLESGPFGEQGGAKKRKTYFEDDQESEVVEPDEAPVLGDDRTPAGQLSLSKRSVQAFEVDDCTTELTNAATEESSPRLTRLEGLSGSTDIRHLLAADAAQEKEEKRKAKKQKKKADGEKVLTDKDKLNKDVMEMERYLKKKATGSGPALEPTTQS